jgi:hypothetical protein
MNSELLESSKELLAVSNARQSHAASHDIIPFQQSKKSYCEMEKVCEEARSKYNEAETRLKKRDLKFFESLSSLEKSHNKASERLKSCQNRTTASRNQLLLGIEMANAHMKQHGHRDLPQIIQVGVQSAMEFFGDDDPLPFSFPAGHGW